MTPKNWFALVGGAVIGLGLLAFRISDSNSFGGIAIAMTLLEIGAVLYLQYVADKYRGPIIAYREQEITLLKAEGTRDVWKQKHDELVHELEWKEQQIQAHISYIGERRQRHQLGPEFEALAAASRMDGYALGVAGNKGKKRHVRIKKEVQK